METLNFGSVNPVQNSKRISKIFDRIFTIIADDGTGEYSTIQAAVTAGKKFLFLKGGTYSITSDLALDDVTIIGESPETTIINMTDGTIRLSSTQNSSAAGTITITAGSTTVAGAGTSFTNVSGDHVFLLVSNMIFEVDTIAGDLSLTLNEQYQGTTAAALSYVLFSTTTSGSSIQNVHIVHTPTGNRHTIDINGVNNSVINCYIEGKNSFCTALIATAQSASHYAALARVEHCTLAGGQDAFVTENLYLSSFNRNTIRNPSRYAVRITPTSIKISISNNNVFACGDHGISFDGVSGHSEIFIFNNNLQEIGGHGIHIYYADDSIVYNNIIDTTGNRGIYVDHSVRCNVSSNNVKNTTSNGIEFFTGSDDGLAIGNRIDASAANGLASVTATGLQFIGNSIKAPATSAVVIGGNSDNCVISNNKIEDGGSIGIWVLSNDCAITGNTIFGTTADGIITAGDRQSVSGNTIDTPSQDGIRLQSENCTINANTILTAGRYGIYAADLGPGGDEQIISNNIIMDPTNHGIYIESNRSVVSGNSIHDGSADGINVKQDQNIVSSNQIQNNTGTGIITQATADRTIIVANLSLNNGVAQLTDGGTNSDLGHNIIV